MYIFYHRILNFAIYGKNVKMKPLIFEVRAKTGIKVCK